MAWTKLSDDFSDDCETLDDAAFRLHVEGLNWSNRKLLDCLIPKDHLRRFATNPDAVHKLLTVGWWKDVDGHYEIVHHAVYQRSRDAVLARQATARRNGAKGGRPPGPPREQAPRKRGKETQTQTQTGSDNRDGLADALATGLSDDGSYPEDKTQTGNPVANPRGQARRSSKRNHKTEVYEGPCLKHCGAVALGSEAGIHENPAWCGGCNDDSANRRSWNRMGVPS